MNDSKTIRFRSENLSCAVTLGSKLRRRGEDASTVSKSASKISDSANSPIPTGHQHRHKFYQFSLSH